MAVKEKTSSTRITQFPASKTSHVVAQKESREGNEKTGSRSTKMYRYHDDSIIASNKKGVKKIPANVQHEKELKEASMKTIDIVDNLLAKCHSHVLESETEEGLKKKKKQPEKADGHTLGTDPAPRSEGEMVKKKESDAHKSWQSGQRYREEQNRLKEQRLHEKEAYKRTRMTGGMSEWGKYKAEADANKREMEEKEKSMTSAIDELMIKARVNRLDYDEDGMPQTPEAQKEFDERGRRNAAMHAGIKPKVPKGVKPRKGEEVDKSMITVVDELMTKARVAASKPRSVKLSPEKEKEVLARHEQKLRSLRQASYKPDYSRYANRMYEEEGGEKSLDERTTDLVKNIQYQSESRDDLSQRFEKFHKDKQRSLKSVSSTWHESSSFITKGNVIGPGGEEATLVKKPSMYDKPLRKIPSGKRTPDYHQLEQKMDEKTSLYKKREAAKKIKEAGLDEGAE